MNPEPDGPWAGRMEGALSDSSYGASITLGEPGDHGRVSSDLDAILAGGRPDLFAIPDGARILEFGSGQFGVVVDHRVRSSELTRISLVRIRR